MDSLENLGGFDILIAAVSAVFGALLNAISLPGGAGSVANDVLSEILEGAPVQLFSVASAIKDEIFEALLRDVPPMTIVELPHQRSR